MHKGKSITESTELQAYIDKESAFKKKLIFHILC